MEADKSYYGLYKSPIGWIEIQGSKSEIFSLVFVDQPRQSYASCSCVDAAIRQISEYFVSTRRDFDLPLALHGTSFQHQVWEQVMSIPYGKTRSYQDIAYAIGRPKAIRAVGAANARNPLSIIVPCHRVIGSDGNLTGYGGGIWRKEWLLKHEGYFQVVNNDDIVRRPSYLDPFC
jgi:methylated-DNA-[protein]-cysteine S-methyltransferase